MIGLLQPQIQTWDGTEDVWRGGIIERTRTTLKARIEEGRGKRFERKEGYSNHEDALRRELGIDPEVDGSEAAGGFRDPGRGHGRRGPQWD